MSLEDSQGAPIEEPSSPVPGPSTRPDPIVGDPNGELEILAPPIFTTVQSEEGMVIQEVCAISGMDIDEGESAYGLQPNDRATPINAMTPGIPPTTLEATTPRDLTQLSSTSEINNKLMKVIDLQQDLKKAVTDYSSVISLLSTNVSRLESGQQSLVENVHEILGIVKKQSQIIQSVTNVLQDISNRIINLESGVSTTTATKQPPNNGIKHVRK
jgi:hypothetical protein